MALEENKIHAKWVAAGELTTTHYVAIYYETEDDFRREKQKVLGERFAKCGHAMFCRVESVTKEETCLISDITVASECHSFIASVGFMVHNSSQMKQALGIYATNVVTRYDTQGHVMWYPQKPLSCTKMAKQFDMNEMPAGANAVVAICCYSG